MSQVDLKHVHQDILKLRQSMELIQHILTEEFELSDEAKSALKKARKTPDSELIDMEEVKKRFL